MLGGESWPVGGGGRVPPANQREKNRWVRTYVLYRQIGEKHVSDDYYLQIRAVFLAAREGTSLIFIQQSTIFIMCLERFVARVSCDQSRIPRDTVGYLN